MRPWALLSIVLLFPAAVCAQDAAVLRDSGERKFQARDYEGAVQDYQQALAGLPSGQDSAEAADLERMLASLRALILHCRQPGVGGYTPSDFPLARLEPSTWKTTVWSVSLTV